MIMRDDKMFIYGINKSFDELKEVLEKANADLNDEKLKKEVNFRLGTFLHWIVDCYDRLPREEIGQQERSFFSGLKYANNKLKHDPSIVKMCQRTGGFSFPMEFPLCIPEIAFCWGDIPFENNKKYQAQFKKYGCHISGKEVLPIAEQALKIVMNHIVG